MISRCPAMGDPQGEFSLWRPRLSWNSQRSAVSPGGPSRPLLPNHVDPTEHPVRLALRGAAVCVAVALSLTAHAARAAQVQDLAARHVSGQTFLTWTSPPGVGWIYRVYASASPIRSTQ